MKLIDATVTSALVALGLGLLAAARASAQDTKDQKGACANNLKAIGLAAVQYADDKRFFPHIEKTTKLDMGGDTTPKGNEVPPRCLRALIYFNYHDDPKGFVCPASDDEPKKMTDKAKSDIREFGWLGSTPDEKVSPLVKAAEKDKDADALTDLSCGWTIKGLTSNSPATSRLAADRAARLGPRTKQKLAGNHAKGWNVVRVDASIEFVKVRGDDATELSRADKEKKASGYLVVWDEANCGDEAKPDKEKDK